MDMDKYLAYKVIPIMGGRQIDEHARATLAWEIVLHQECTRNDEVDAAHKILLDYLTFGVK